MKLTKQILIEMVESVIKEKTAYKKRGVNLPGLEDKLRKYVGTDAEAQYFIQFSDINKLGINPKSKFDTPLGIYAYPLTQLIFDRYVEGSLPFASDRQYLILFKPKEGTNIIDPGNDISDEQYEKYKNMLLYNKKFEQFEKYTPKGLEWFRDKIEDLKHFEQVKVKGEKNHSYKEWIASELYGEINKIEEQSKWNNNNFGKLWNVTRELSDKKMKIWTYMLRALGIDGVVDYGNGLIHENEPTQAVFFGKDKIEMVGVFPNELSSDKIRKRKATKKNIELRKKGIPLAGDVIKLSDEYLKELENDYRIALESFEKSNSNEEEIKKLRMKLENELKKSKESTGVVIFSDNTEATIFLYDSEKDAMEVSRSPNWVHSSSSEEKNHVVQHLSFPKSINKIQVIRRGRRNAI